MGPLEMLIILLFWVAPAAGVGWLATRRHRGFLPYFAISLLISWILGLAIVLLQGEGEPKPPDESERADLLAEEGQ